MTIQFACSCGRQLQADESRVGRRIKCFDCGAEMTVPAAAQPAETVPPKPSPVRGEGPPPRVAADEGEEDGPRLQGRDDEGELEDYLPGAERKTSAMATAALVLGLLAFFLGIILAIFVRVALVSPNLTLILPIPALILGIMALVKIRRSRGRLGGKWWAIIGMTVGCLGQVFTHYALWWWVPDNILTACLVGLMLSPVLAIILLALYAMTEGVEGIGSRLYAMLLLVLSVVGVGIVAGVPIAVCVVLLGPGLALVGAALGIPASVLFFIVMGAIRAAGATYSGPSRHEWFNAYLEWIKRTAQGKNA
jgi:hypothetical protein